MYGTIARLRVQDGKVEAFRKHGEEISATPIAGMVDVSVFQMDADSNEFYLVVRFESKEADQVNAASPEQHARYEQLRALLTADPEWHDGSVVVAPGAG